MKESHRTGVTFGFTSAIITTLGLMIGLHSGTNSKLAVLGGILTIAIADAFSDALGIHLSEESERVHNLREIWESTISTFLAKLSFALTFIIPVIYLDLQLAMIVSVIWGLLALSFLSYVIAKSNRERTLSVIGEHLLIAIIVIITTHFVGEWIRNILS